MFEIPESIQQAQDAAICLYSAEEVERALDNLAKEINQQLADSCPVIMCVMNGGIVPTGMLLTRLDFLLQVDYLHATRYQDETSGNDILWKVEPNIDLKGRTVLVIDDILDEGITLATIIELCESRGADTVLSAVLVEKLHERKASNVQADFVGLKIEDRYVFGYGMDYRGYLRNAAGIFAVREED